jgi:hypothetical protein
MAILFPLIAIGCCGWILVAMISYVAEIQRDIKSSNNDNKSRQ